MDRSTPTDITEMFSRLKAETKDGCQHAAPGDPCLIDVNLDPVDPNRIRRAAGVRRVPISKRHSSDRRYE